MNQLKIFREHTELYEETWQGNKSFSILNYFLKIYCKEFRGVANLIQ